MVQLQPGTTSLAFTPGQPASSATAAAAAHMPGMPSITQVLNGPSAMDTAAGSMPVAASPTIDFPDDDDLDDGFDLEAIANLGNMGSSDLLMSDAELGHNMDLWNSLLGLGEPAEGTPQAAATAATAAQLSRMMSDPLSPLAAMIKQEPSL